MQASFIKPLMAGRERRLQQKEAEFHDEASIRQQRVINEHHNEKFKKIKEQKRRYYISTYRILPSLSINLYCID